MTDNAAIVGFLKRHASLMQLAGLNSFRVRAFDNAARRLEELEVDIAKMSATDTLTEVDGIGKGLAEFVAEFIESGTTAAYDELTETVPETPEPEGEVFTLNPYTSVDLVVKVTHDGQPSPFTKVTVTDALRPPRGDEVIEDLITGNLYHQGVTDKNGEVRATFRVPSRFTSIDVVVNRSRSEGPYTHEELKDLWGPYAPSARVTVDLESSVDVKINLRSK